MTVALQGCFTGVESTPKITAADVRREGIRTTPEQEYEKHFAVAPLTQWEPGRRLMVENPKINLVMGSAAATFAPAAGDVLRYEGFRTAPSLTGVRMVELMLTQETAPADTILYRTRIPMDALADSVKVGIPFTVDLTLLDEAAPWLVGREFYLLNALRYDATTAQPMQGRKFVRAAVEKVVPGDAANPIGVVFVDEDSREGMLLMGATDSPSSRPFHTLFSLSDPRASHPTVADEVWALITEEKVKPGMNRTECRLALGAPAEVDRGRDYSSAYERWGYPDGTYLIFQDGILTLTNK